MERAAAPLGFATQALQAAAALLAAVVLQLGAVGGASAAQTYSLSSVAEDHLLEFVRQMEVRVDSGMEAVKAAAAQGADSPEAAEGRQIIQEVAEVVEANFSDVRAAGYDPQAWQQLKERALARPLRDRTAAYGVVRELLAVLRDPYSRFVTPTEFSAMLKYDVSGVGLNLGTAEEFANKTGMPLPEGRNVGSAAGGEGVWVVGLIKGLAADSAGLQQGDQLLELDGQQLQGQSPFQVASLMQGPEAAPEDALGLQGAAVRLKVRRFDGSKQAVTLQRPVRVLQSPVSSRLERSAGGEQVGFIRLASFNARAQRDTLAAVQRLQAAGASRLVLDLRDNRGGLVSEGIEVARLFLDDGALVVRTEGRARSSAAPITAAGAPATAAPLVVLVNDHTASASEIVAGALRDNCRAVLAGKRTYGKGLIQSVYELSDGSGLVLTVGKYVTPSGTDIDREGLSPDFRAMPAAEAADGVVRTCRLQRAPQLQAPQPAAAVAAAAAAS
ncbi:peptidase S41 family [Micractinium conductrix]|uniref:C-terminal processing peptidase n=1 Tax=Micractinium conductrix TaxID=554055 RepID=A0A2P6V9H5_9CHLO|nr:peptidase S41 family [Micractinium conductrix]|eukprot:PSC70735.1 peptidase S41 family [Micractinium conductrix]